MSGAISRRALLAAVLFSAPVLLRAQDAKPVAATQNVPSYAAAAQDAQQLSPQSRDVFLRGLMPLPDYLEHLSVIYEAEARNTLDKLDREARSKPGYESSRPPQYDSKQLEKAFRPVYQARLAALQEAVERLEAFRQPAAKGWAADVALARVALQQAQADTARLFGKKAEVAELSEAEQQLAAQHYWARLEDARTGQASLPAMVQAASLLNIAPEFRRELLQGAADQTIIWERRGAGIGRQDEVTQSQINLTWLDGYRTRRDGSLQVNDAAWREADRLANQLFQERSQFYTRGTASLADLSRAWLVREQMHEIAVDAKYKIPKASSADHQQNLQKLRDVAAATTDHRGRNAADVTFVRLLGDLNAAEQIP